MTLPYNWRVMELTDVAEVRLGRQRSPSNHTGPNMRPYLRAANVTWGGLKLDDVKSMNFTEQELTTYRLKAGDILLSEASGSPGEVGKPALWRDEIPDCAFQNTLIRVRPLRIDPEYLTLFFRYQALSGAFADVSRGVGIHHLSRAKLARWQVPVPPLLDQRRIVDTLEEQLSHLAAARRLIEESNKRAELLNQILFRSAFTGQLARASVRSQKGA